MANFRKAAGVQLIIMAHMVSFSQHSLAGQYDNQVLAEVSAKEFIMILDQPVPKLFKRTQLPNAQNNLCTVNNGQASSVAIASKLRVVGGAGVSNTLPAGGSNTVANTANTANTTQNNKPSSAVRTNTTSTTTTANSSANTSTGSTTAAGIAPNRTQSGEVQTSASTYVPSLPTPRTSTSGNTNTTSNSNAVAPRTTTAPVVANHSNNNTSGSNTSNTASVNTSNNQVRPTQQVATNTTATQNRPVAANTANTTAQNSSTATTTNADVPYVGNAIATVNLAVNFGNDSDRLSTQDKALLKELASALNSVELKNSDFAIVGHTNSTGPLVRNLELSCARAIAVRNYLIDLRVNANRLTPYGFGPDKPLANVAAQDAVNRRVEISRAK